MRWIRITLVAPRGLSLIGVIRTRSPAESSVCNRICRTSWKNALRLQFAFVNWSFVFLFYYLCSCSCCNCSCSCFLYAGHAPFWHMPRVARASYLDTRCNQHELLSSINSSSFNFWTLSEGSPALVSEAGKLGNECNVFSPTPLSWFSWSESWLSSDKVYPKPKSKLRNNIHN